ncbi:acylphosphatase [Alsobacter sp. KACC 23698]|uniref:acylphosphatase n=1 Tax=Alsobacter sp. KACC 23698 TaxID=3149229 RepID=A0AAU7JMS3_9HYPH
MTRNVRVVITGRVQGVGYRAWTERHALRRGLSGWVRNRVDGSVEAVFCGDPQAVDDMLLACRHGPRASEVTQVTTFDDAEPVGGGFVLLPTA